MVFRGERRETSFLVKASNRLCAEWRGKGPTGDCHRHVNKVRCRTQQRLQEWGEVEAGGDPPGEKVKCTGCGDQSDM